MQCSVPWHCTDPIDNVRAAFGWPERLPHRTCKASFKVLDAICELRSCRGYFDTNPIGVSLLTGEECGKVVHYHAEAKLICGVGPWVIARITVGLGSGQRGDHAAIQHRQYVEHLDDVDRKHKGVELVEPSVDLHHGHGGPDEAMHAEEIGGDLFPQDLRV